MQFRYAIKNIELQIISYGGNKFASEITKPRTKYSNCSEPEIRIEFATGT